MKVPDIVVLASMLLAYEQQTGKEVMIMVDATFAPGSKCMEKLATVAPTLTAMTFISMSKSVSRGMTTAGAIIAGPSAKSSLLLSKVRETAKIFDTTARPDQLLFLTQNHVGVETRCAHGYEVASTVGRALKEAVFANCGGYDMPLEFVSPENALLGFTSSTFSFNLPAIANAAEGVNSGLAQKLVDQLCAHNEFKPCVSFGQDNGLVYATVPATSTQGAIKAEDKDKQAVGGVQLTRLSFPPTCDVDAVCAIMKAAVANCCK
jgi:cysteine synthase A